MINFRFFEMFDICCDVCNTNFSDKHGFAMSEEEKDSMAIKAENEGWTYNEFTLKNLCPECTSKENNKVKKVIDVLVKVNKKTDGKEG